MWVSSRWLLLPARGVPHAVCRSRVKEVPIGVGVLAIGLNAVAGVYGAWCWWRAISPAWFWRLLRSAQVVIVLEAALGGVLTLIGHKPPGLHVVYGLLPLAVSFIGEQLRAVSA